MVEMTILNDQMPVYRGQVKCGVLNQQANDT